jgi:ectoine hydroxylase-related dioxygenase (phytanoyl-CoA dioxygenase family)
MQLSDEQLRAFDERGYVVVPNVVPREVVDETNEAIDRLLREDPPSADAIGHYFYWVYGLSVGADPEWHGVAVQSRGIAGRRDSVATNDTASIARVALLRLLRETPVASLAKSLCAATALEIAFDQAQIALCLPPFPHSPGGGHIDGCEFDEDGRPGSFTMLIGVLLSDQTRENTGNLWVWPGTHRTHAAYFREHGPDSIATCEQHMPRIDLHAPTQVVGNAGDLVLAHYLLGHNTGGNYESDEIRRCVYYRVRKLGHLDRWREAITDERLEFDGVRAAEERHVRAGG